MGEHIAPSVAEWFAKHFTNKENSIVNAYYQTENGAIISSPTYKEKTSQAPHGSAGKLSSKFIKTNKLFSKEKKEMKIISPWPGNMKKIINLLNSKLNPSILKVVNESHMHNVPEGSESHFKLIIVSESFKLSLIHI